MRHWVLLGWALGLGTVASASAQSFHSDDPRAIMKELDRLSASDKRSARMRLTIAGGGGDKHERLIRLRSKGDAKTRKSLMLVEGPADMRGTGFISVQYPGTDQAAERWLYMPKLKRTTRVAGGQLSSQFLGSDFTYADLSQLDPELFNYTLVKPSEEVDGEDCWVITAKPKLSTTGQEVGYGETQFWISKSKLALVRMRASLVDSKRQKYFRASNFRKVGAAWFPDTLSVRTVEEGKMLSESTMQTLENKVDADVSDADFSKDRLEVGL